MFTTTLPPFLSFFFFLFGCFVFLFLQLFSSSLSLCCVFISSGISPFCTLSSGGEHCCGLGLCNGLQWDWVCGLKWVSAGVGVGCRGYWNGLLWVVHGVHFAVDPCSLCGGSPCSSDFGTNQWWLILFWWFWDDSVMVNNNNIMVIIIVIKYIKKTRLKMGRKFYCQTDFSNHLQFIFERGNCIFHPLSMSQFSPLIYFFF